MYKFLKAIEKKAKAVHCIVFTTLRCLWKTHKDLVSSEKSTSLVKIVEDIKSLGFLGHETSQEVFLSVKRSGDSLI